MKNINKIFFLLIFFNLIFQISFSKNNISDMRRTGLEIGNKIPEFILVSVDGKEKISSKTFQGKLTLYNFGATWCKFCRVERPTLNEFYKKNKSRANVVSIINESSDKEIYKYFKEIPVDFKSYQDSDGKLFNKFLIQGTPTTYIVNSHGIIIQKIPGALNWSNVTVEMILEGRE
ncbi:MAG: TlpA family protein disulfide reductase [Fusobacteriaceae bacterium]